MKKNNKAEAVPVPGKPAKGKPTKGRPAKGTKKKAAKQKPAPHWRPKKEDRMALEVGELTTAAKKMNVVVDRAFGVTERYRKHEERYEEAMLAIYDRIAPQGKGLTIMSADGKRRVIYSHKNVVSGNQNAVEAKGLIDDYVTEMLSTAGLTSDERSMAEFLTSVITESKGSIKLTRNLVDFQRRKFEDPRLRKAQSLLRDGFDVAESKVYFYCERLIGEDWVKI
jgi:hypothetical protein